MSSSRQLAAIMFTDMVGYTSLMGEDFTRQIVYTSKEEAAKSYSEELGEDFVSYLGTNPLKNSIDIYP